MKFMTFIAFLIMSVTMISCGGDDKDKSSSNRGFSTSKLSTSNGYLDINSMYGHVEVGGQIYQLSQQHTQVVLPALQQAQMKNIQPINHNGVRKYRAKITAQLMNYNQGYNQGYNQQGGYNQGYDTGYVQGTLNITNIVIY